MRPLSAIQLEARSIFSCGAKRRASRPAKRPARNSSRSPTKIPSRQATVPRMKLTFPCVTSSPVPMQVRSSLMNVAKAIRISCSMDMDS